MKYFQNLKHRFLSFIICIIGIISMSIFSHLTAPAILAMSYHKDFSTDTTPYLTVYPSQLNGKNCQASNDQTWTCTVTLSGQNIVDTVAWNTYTPYSSISISPSKGYLAQVAFIVQVTISNIPCVNTSFLFSGQVLGGGGVIPTTISWSCLKQPTPTPTAKTTVTVTPTIVISIKNTPEPRPTSIPTVHISTPIATATHSPKPMITPLPTLGISPISHGNPPKKGDDALPSYLLVFSTFIIAFITFFFIFLKVSYILFKR